MPDAVVRARPAQILLADQPRKAAPLTPAVAEQPAKPARAARVECRGLEERRGMAALPRREARRAAVAPVAATHARGAASLAAMAFVAISRTIRKTAASVPTPARLRRRCAAAVAVSC